MTRRTTTPYRDPKLPLRVRDASALSVSDLVRLAQTESPWHVSLYLPTHVAGRDVTQDPIRFRNLLGEAERELADAATPSLAVAAGLADDPKFWAHGSAGLGLLVDAHSMTAFRLDDQVDELTVVSDRFHVKPLVPAATHAMEFDVLALSRNAVRFVRGSRSGSTEITVDGMPTSLSEALSWDDRERQLHTHAAGRVGQGRVTPAFHGQNVGPSTRDSDTRRFLQAVDHAVVTHRGNSTTPLVLAGVDELVADYRAITRCQPLVDDHVAGNPDRWRADELAGRARPLVEPLALLGEQRARDTFHAASDRTLDTIEQTLIAAVAGHVESIFVPGDQACWGRYTPGRKTLVEHDERRPGDHDLCDVAVVETLRHGGRAFVVPTSDLPGTGSAAAILRYA